MKRTPHELQAVSVQEVQEILREARESLAPEKCAVLESLLDSYVHITVALSEQTATVARLRRMFGIETSERLDRSSPKDDSANADADADTTQTSAEPEATSAEATSAEATAAEATAAEARGDQEPTPEGDAASNGDEPKKRPNHGRRPASEYAADNTDVKHPELEPGRDCPDCARGTLYLLRKKAPVIRLTGQPIIRADSWTADSLRCSACGTCFSPELPEEARGPRFKNSAVVMIAYLHYVMGMPLERFAQCQNELGVPVPASNQWSMLDRASAKIDRVYECLKMTASQASLLHLDDTTMTILELVGRRRAAAIESGLIDDPTRTGVYTTGVLALGGQAPPIALFFTGVQHAGENLEMLLELRPPDLDKPVVMTDALNRNVPARIADRVVEANCMSHGRRGVFDQMESFPAEVRHVLEELAKVFVLDAVAKKDELTPAERLELHQRNSGAIMGRLRQWIRRKLYRERAIEPNSELGRALKYILKHWPKLTLFLRKPDVPLTNNICERLLKVAIRYRKNSSFYKTVWRCTPDGSIPRLSLQVRWQQRDGTARTWASARGQKPDTTFSLG